MAQRRDAERRRSRARDRRRVAVQERRAEWIGAARFATTLSKAESAIGELGDPLDTAGAIIAEAGAANAPVLTGALRGSVRAKVDRRYRAPRGAVALTSPLTYAGPIHWGVPSHNISATPFLLMGAEQTQSQWVGAIESHAQKVCASVKGR